MKRIAVIGLVIAASIVSSVAGAGVALQYVEGEASHRLALRTAHWTHTLNDEVKVGEPKSDVQAWIDRTVRRPIDGDNFDAANKKFFVIVDDIQEPVAFPCSDWYLTVEITLGPDDRVTSRRVASSGACV